MLWLVGIVAGEDEAGRALKNDVDGQARCIFRNMPEILKDADAPLADLVSMTVFITSASDNWATAGGRI